LDFNFHPLCFPIQYFGGKGKIAKYIEPVLTNSLSRSLSSSVYHEPFCGGLWIAARVARYAKRAYLSDLCRPLITLYQAMQNGFVPPGEVSEETYQQYKKNQYP
jgi:site-specific DNA-adenine methylase